MSTDTLISICLAISGIVNVWWMYMHKSKREADKELVSNIERRSNNDISDLKHNYDKLTLRVTALEKHSITEAKTKELIDDAVRPLHENLNEIKRDGKEAQKDIKALLVGFSNLLGQFGQKPSNLNKD